jgi:hypothetical protein
MHMPKPNRLPTKWLSSALPRGACVAGALLLSLAGSPAAALTFTPISADSFVHGEIVGSLGPFSQTDTSTALEPILDIQESRSSGNISVHSFLTATISAALAIPTVVITSGDIAKTSGFNNDTAITYGYTLSFTLDGPSLARLVNGNSGGAFPRVTTGAPSDSSSLTYELRAAGGATAFLYSAPTTNSSGTYAEATLSAGTYEFIVTGEANAVSDPCCTLHAAEAGGIARLEFEDAPVAPVPMVSPFGGLLLIGLLGSAGAHRLVRKNRR